MLLKSLELYGFKTFADKTVLLFDRGITAVVGPNGSGKSNISDAMRWVLGEQSVKSLRCGRMEDIIFNGTAKRGSKGFAQVTMVIDNSEGRMPVGSTEVLVSRRYYRSGESEYLVNNVAVRLKDIHELFMDTGLGRDGYSMIGQGKIDSILSSRSEERREIFEEAAGISRYRYRKAEAVSKLGQAQDNLLRLRDTLDELESRVRPLKEQAGKAREYVELAGSKKELEISLWLSQLCEMEVNIKAHEDMIRISSGQRDAIQVVIDDVCSQIENTLGQANALSASVDETRRSISQLEQSSVQKNGEILVLKNDLFHNSQNIEKIDVDIAHTELFIEETRGKIAKKRECLNSMTVSLDTKKAELESLSEKFKELQRKTWKFVSEYDKLVGKINQQNDKLSAGKSKLLAAGASVEELNFRKASVSQNLDRYRNNIVDLLEKSNQYSQKFAMYLGDEERLSEEVKILKNSIDESRKDIKSVQDRADKCLLDLREQLRRKDMLEEMEKSMEGFSRSVKEVIHAGATGKLNGIRGPVTQILSVPGEFSIAVETALGAASQNIVVDSETDAKQAIYYLKEKNAGRATFLPISSIKGSILTDSEVKKHRGFLGIAAQLCSCDSSYKDIKSYLLGRIVIADNIDNAGDIARAHGYRFKVVTIDGQVINAGGSFTGGSVGKGSGFLSRAAEIKKTAELVAMLNKTKGIFHQELIEKAEKEKRLNSKLDVLQQEFEETRLSKLSSQSERDRYTSEAVSMEEILLLAQAEVLELSEKLTRLTELSSRYDIENEQLKNDIIFNQSELRKLDDRKIGVNEQSEGIRESVQNARLSVLSLEKDIESQKLECDGLEREKTEKQIQVDLWQKEKISIYVCSEDIKEKIAVYTEEIGDIKKKCCEYEKNILKNSGERMALECKVTALRQKERESISEMAELSLDVARLNDKRITLQNEYDGIISRLWDEYDLTRREAQKQYQVSNNVKETTRLINEIRVKIKSMGTVNVGAIDEYKEVSERYEFMSKQVGDVEKAKVLLENLIAELIDQMEMLFKSKFCEISDHFSQIFGELFGGGSAELKLTDKSNVLECGVEIRVRPAGKIVTSLEALSGGEKALVAICIYFAILRVNPAPFCVLDEIEAALDEVNVDRFASYLQRVKDRTQFIVISHRRGTMEAADVLYGVTMQDQGISRLLRLNTVLH